MAEPFKNLLNKHVVEGMANHFKRHCSDFNDVCFISNVMEGFELLELKARTERITDVMVKYFPTDFNKAGKILLSSLGAPLANGLSNNAVDDNGIAGWAITPLAHYVGLKGHQHFDLSMTLLKEMTKRATSEFAIRFFLIESTEKTLLTLDSWVEDSNQHVRRLVSEGSRPRLPWAMSLPKFILDPAPVIKLLEKLKDDEQEYVRRSVANNLNDISKDHPDLVAKIAKKWMVGASHDRKKLIRHACRTLVKKGHKKTLSTLGFHAPKIKPVSFNVLTPTVVFENALQFELAIESAFNQEQALMIDYIIYHQKANGKTSPKVFKWRTVTLKPGEKLMLEKSHVIRKITTRVYHKGLHSVEVLINGVAMGKTDFQLFMP